MDKFKVGDQVVSNETYEEIGGLPTNSKGIVVGFSDNYLLTYINVRFDDEIDEHPMLATEIDHAPIVS